MKTHDVKERRNLKLSILIFALLAAGILTAGYLYYIDYEHKYRTVVEGQLSAIAELKVGELVQWRKERIADAQLFYDNEVFSLLVKRYVKNRNDREAKTRIMAWMGEAQKANRYDLAMLVDANFNTRLVIPESKEGVHLILDEQITETLRSGKIAFQDFYRNDKDQRVYLKILVPIRDIGALKPLLGILALRIDPEEYLYPLIQQWPIPSRTSETLIVRKEGSDALFLNELKFQTNSALNLRIPLTHTNTPAVEAALGKEGIIEGVDYRGVPVIADIRSVPNSPWFLVARVDVSEAYAPVRERLSMLIYLIIALLLGSGASVGLLWRREHARFYRQQYEGAQELISSEARYRRLFEAAWDGILILDADSGMVVDVNPFLIELLGYSREQFLGKRIWELGFFKDTAASKLNLKELQEKKFIRYEDLPLETSDGRRIEVEFVSNVYLVDHHNVIQCNIRDITERRRAEGELLIANKELVFQNEEKEKRAAELIIANKELVIQNEDKEKRAAELVIANKELVFQIEERKHAEASFARLAAIVESSDDAIIGKDLNGIITSWNTGAEKLFGYSAHESVGRSITQIVPQDRLTEEEQILCKIRRNESVQHYDTARLAKNGQLIDVSVTVSPIKDVAGNVVGASKVARNITERKHAEEKLRETNEYLESLFNYANAPIIVWDTQFRITRFNNAFEALTGRNASDVIGKSLEILFPPDRLESSMSLIKKTLKGERWNAVEIEILHVDGSIRTVLWNSATIFAFDGKTPIATIAQGHDITERKHAEEALKTSEELFRTASESLTDVVYDWDIKEKVDWYGDIDGITGYPPGGFPRTIGGWAATIHPEDKDRVLAALDGHLKNTAPYVVQYRVRRKDGKWRWWSARGTALRNNRGEPYKMIGSISDITERKLAEQASRRAEDKLRESEAKLRTLVENIPQKILMKDRNYRWVSVNENLARDFGFRPEEVVGKMDADLFTPELAAKYHSDDVRIMETGKTEEIEEKYMVAGKETWVNTIKTPVRGANGEIEGVLGVFWDITGRKLAESQIRKLNRMYLVLSEVNQAIVRIYEPKEMFEKVCRIAVEQGGFAMTWIGLIDESTQKVQVIARAGKEDGYLETINISLNGEPLKYCPIDSALRQGKHSICAITENKETAPCQKLAYDLGFRSSASLPLKVSTILRGVLTFYSNEPEFFEEEELKLLDELASDISFAMEFAEKEAERARGQEEIRTLNAELEDRVVIRTAQLEASNKELEAFSYSVSHDLRAPLRHVSGYVELLAKHFRSELTEKGLHYLDSIADSAHQMGKLIDDLLQFSRTGRAEIHLSQLDMNGIVHEAVESVTKDNPDRAIEWVVGKLPSVSGDDATLRLVWINLLSNAAKFTRTRAKAVIEIGANAGAKEVIYFVKDNGVGFEMKYAQKLFGVFQRLHSTEEFEGTGVGLANVRRIVTRHGGRTWAEAELDKGATFYFSIPHN